MNLMERFTSLGTYQPWERRRLLDLAVLRCALVALAILGLAIVRAGQGWPSWLIVTLAPADACLVALVSADCIEHALKVLIFGYSYNPNVMARGEFEGSMTIMDAAHESVWRATMFRRLAIGDDPASGHYPLPLPWRARWRHLFGGD